MKAENWRKYAGGDKLQKGGRKCDVVIIHGGPRESVIVYMLVISYT